MKEHLRAIPNKGIGFGAIMGYHHDLLPSIGFNYLGQFDTNASSQAWQIAAESAGIAINPSNSV